MLRLMRPPHPVRPSQAFAGGMIGDYAPVYEPRLNSKHPPIGGCSQNIIMLICSRLEMKTALVAGVSVDSQPKIWRRL
jgi:hypothetical protein